MDEEYEYCPRCQADLTLQKGYHHDLPCWVCRGCGEMLINPEVTADSDTAWFCDQCGAMLNQQAGFSEEGQEWVCTECGYRNKLDQSGVYETQDEYQADLVNPYRGLSDDEVLGLSYYTDEEHVDGRCDVIRVIRRDNGRHYIKKLLTTYEKSLYEYLMDHPIGHMPRIRELYESDHYLIVIEDYIMGPTLGDLLKRDPLTRTGPFVSPAAYAVSSMISITSLYRSSTEI